mgnify:CR=1 FL=1
MIVQNIFIFIALEEVFSNLCMLVVPRQTKKMAGEHYHIVKLIHLKVKNKFSDGDFCFFLEVFKFHCKRKIIPILYQDV